MFIAFNDSAMSSLLLIFPDFDFSSEPYGFAALTRTYYFDLESQEILNR